MPFQADLSSDRLRVTEGSGGTAIADIDSASRDSFILGKLSLGPPQLAADSTLEVKGAVAVGAGYGGGGVMPGNSLAVEGSVGIGTKTPAAKLDVNGGAFLGYETSVTDFGGTLKSGFYENTGAKVTGDVPDTAHSWTHVIAARHSNTANNHQLQIAASYATNDKLYFRKIAASGAANPAWNEVATRGPNTFFGDQGIRGLLTVGTNPVRFTSQWSGFPDATNNQAEICNDTMSYKTLMIVGNKSGGLGRRVSVWDRLEVNGTFVYTGQMNKLDVADNFSATVRAADLYLGHSGRRGSPGRALVDYKDPATGNTLRINFGGDWTGGCRYYVSMEKASSRKFKKNVEALKVDAARGIVERLQPVRFNLKRDDRQRSHLGFIAEEVPPEVGAPDREAVNTDHIVAVLTCVVKDQQRAIADMQARMQCQEHLGRN